MNTESFQPMGSCQGRIQDFKLGGGAVKKIAVSGGRRENCWGISCEKSRFYAKKSYFSNFVWRKIVIFHMKYPKNFARPP